MTDEPRVFICDIEPAGEGGWDVWIKKETHDGRPRNSQLVGTYHNEQGARKGATRAIRRAQKRAANLARKSLTIRSDGGES